MLLSEVYRSKFRLEKIMSTTNKRVPLPVVTSRESVEVLPSEKGQNVTPATSIMPSESVAHMNPIQMMQMVQMMHMFNPMLGAAGVMGGMPVSDIGEIERIQAEYNKRNSDLVERERLAEQRAREQELREKELQEREAALLSASTSETEPVKDEPTDTVEAGNMVEDIAIPETELAKDEPTDTVGAGNTVEDTAIPETEPAKDEPTDTGEADNAEADVIPELTKDESVDTVEVDSAGEDTAMPAEPAKDEPTDTAEADSAGEDTVIPETEPAKDEPVDTVEADNAGADVIPELTKDEPTNTVEAGSMVEDIAIPETEPTKDEPADTGEADNAVEDTAISETEPAKDELVDTVEADNAVEDTAIPETEPAKDEPTDTAEADNAGEDIAIPETEPAKDEPTDTAEADNAGEDIAIPETEPAKDEPTDTAEADNAGEDIAIPETELAKDEPAGFTFGERFSQAKYEEDDILKTEVAETVETKDTIKLDGNLLAGLQPTQVSSTVEDYQQNIGTVSVSDFIRYNKDQIPENEVHKLLEEKKKRKERSMEKISFEGYRPEEVPIVTVLERFGFSASRIRNIISRIRLTGESISVVMKEFGFGTQEQVAAIHCEIDKGDFTFVSEKDSESIKVSDECKKHVLPRMEIYAGAVPFEIFNEGTDEKGNPTGSCKVLISDPGKLGDLGSLVDPYTPVAYLTTETAVNSLYRRFYSSTEKKIDDMLELYRSLEEDTVDISREYPTLTFDILGYILRHAAQNKVSDIQMHGTGSAGIVKFKVDGSSMIFKTIPSSLHEQIINLMIQDNGIQEQDVDKNILVDAVLDFKDNGNAARFQDVFKRFRFRVEVGKSKGMMTAVMRLLDTESNTASLANLDFDEQTKQTMLRYAGSSTGLVIVTGPTGSGKTTTLYSILQEIDPVENSIQTVEKPIEYTHGLWMQYGIPVGGNTENEGNEWNQLLKGLLRNAPDVILMGEVRDSGTAAVLLDASDTGHLVFTTLHTNSSSSAIGRLRKLKVDNDALASQLLGIIAQRLVRKVCPKCGVCPNEEEGEKTMQVLRDYLPSEEVAKASIGDLRVPSEEGCLHCNFTGYKGRTVVYEVLDNNGTIQPLIEGKAPISEIAKKGLRPYYHMWHTGLRLVLNGVTSLEEVSRETKPEVWLLDEIEKQKQEGSTND